MRIGRLAAYPVSCFALVLLAACDSKPASPTDPAEPAETALTAGSTTCTKPYGLFPGNPSTLHDEPNVYTWFVDSCRAPHRVQIRDDATNTLVWDDSNPGSQTFQENDRFEYFGVPSGTLTRGRKYRWRIRSKLQDAGSGETLGPWSDESTFGIAPAIPVTSGSISAGHPHLDWTATEGASTYNVYRQVNEGGSWSLWHSTSSTSYTDVNTDVTEYLGTHLPPFGTPWVAYRVAAESSQGLESGTGNQHYYSPDEGPVLE